MSENYDKIRQRSQARRTQWIEENGPCVKCGTWDNLEVDHIDPSTKEYEIANIWRRSQYIRDHELAKCQTLCNSCHIEKSTFEQKAAKPVSHGSYKCYNKYKCRCDICVTAMRKRAKIYRQNNRDRMNAYAKNYYQTVIKVKKS
jgi:hypothetical protein